MRSYSSYGSYDSISSLLGKTLKDVKVVKDVDGQDEIHFYTDCGLHYKMTHVQDCCEYVWLEDVVGDVEDLIGHPILVAEEVVSEDNSPTWTFYKLATVKSYVDLRWCGDSNGYYSEAVDFMLQED